MGNKKNGYAVFVAEWKKEQEKHGRRFKDGMKDAFSDSECVAAWAALSDVEKADYKTLAKQSVSDNLKKTTVGESIEEIKRIEQESARMRDNMLEYIHSKIEKSFKAKNLTSQKFYVIHVNYFYFRQLEENVQDYCPAEIGIAEFSLQRGVERVFNAIITPQIALGYAYEASLRSQANHNLPTTADPNFPSKKFDENLFDEICRFLEPGREDGRFSPLYTRFHDEDVKFPIVNILNKLTSQYGRQNFRIYAVEELFAELNNIHSPNVTIPMNSIIAHIELKKDPFEYQVGLECQFHETIRKGNNCSQSYVRRWVLVIRQICCPLYRIPIDPNHLASRENRQGPHDPDEIRPNGPGVQRPNDANRQRPNGVDRINDLSNRIKGLEIQGERKGPQFDLSASTGAVKKYTKYSAERSQQEESLRRFQAADEPLHIIQHGDEDDIRNAKMIFNSEFVAAAEKNSVSSFSDCSFANSSTSSDSAYQSDFPPLSIGRGRRTTNAPPKVVNYASKLKK